MHTVVVEPLPVGWCVAASVGEQYFLSGKSAEHSARQLAQRLATAGEWTELTLRLRGGSLAARYLCLPPSRPDEPPVMIETPGVRRTFRNLGAILRPPDRHADGRERRPPSRIFGLIERRTP